MALTPIEYDGGGYEDKTVTINKGNDYKAIEFNNIGTLLGYQFVYNDDLYHIANDVSNIVLSVLNNAITTIRIAGWKENTHSTTYSIKVRRFYK